MNEHTLVDEWIDASPERRQVLMEELGILKYEQRRQRRWTATKRFTIALGGLALATLLTMLAGCETPQPVAEPCIRCGEIKTESYGVEGVNWGNRTNTSSVCCDCWQDMTPDQIVAWSTHVILENEGCVSQYEIEAIWEVAESDWWRDAKSD